MKKTFCILLAGLYLCSCSKYTQQTLTAACSQEDSINRNYPLKDTLKKILQDYTASGFPGLVLAIYSPANGYWGTGSGFAKIETGTPLQLCHLQYLQSASKMYMAAAILKLHEEGLVNLDAPITKYLPERFSNCIDNAASMSVRNLLNQTSGIPDYLANPAYVTYVLQHPDYLFSSEEILGFIKNKKQRFRAGSKFEYSNSNFHVLALIGDAVYGDHNELIRKKILQPNGLSGTYYRNITGHPELVNSYFDRFSQGRIENVSTLQQTSITFSRGDDGIIATPFDAINFLRSLMEGRMLSDSSLHQMLDFVKNDAGQPVYGMGIYHTSYSSHTGYGHGGAGAGAGCGLYYFPDKKMYVFLATNAGTLVGGPIATKADELKNKILKVVLGN